MTATQPNSDGTATQAINRRAFMKGLGVSTATAAGVGSASMSVAADDDDDGFDEGDAAKSGAALLLGGPAAAASVAYGALISGPDDEEVADAIDYEQHVNEYTRAQQDNISLSETIASLSRDVQLVQNKAREEAIFAIYEQGVDSGTEADAEAAAIAAIDDAFAVPEEAIYRSYDLRLRRYHSFAKTVHDSDFYEADYHQLEYVAPDGSVQNSTDGWGVATIADFEDENPQTTTVELLNGQNLTYAGGEQEDDSVGAATTKIDPRTTNIFDSPPNDLASGGAIKIPLAENYDTVDEDPDLEGEHAVVVNAKPFHDILVDLYDEHDAMLDEVTSMVDTYYEPAANGEIDLSNMLGPAHLTDTAQNGEDFEESALALRGMGYKLADEPSELSFPNPDGDEPLEAEGRLARTVEDPNPLAVGEEIDPSTTVGSIYFAYNERDEEGNLLGGNIAELTDPFTIESAGGASEVSFESRQLAESDHDLTAEEIAEMFEEHSEANDEAREVVHEVAVGGGGISLPGLDGDVNLGIVAAAVAVGAYLLGR